jgi:hypothetical protein
MELFLNDGGNALHQFLLSPENECGEEQQQQRINDQSQDGVVEREIVLDKKQSYRYNKI